MIDDVAFYSSLIACILLGSYYKTIPSKRSKRTCGTGIGLMVACIVCGQNIYQSLILVLGNTAIITCCDQSYLHYLSFLYTWLLLIHFHGIGKKTQYEVWMFQALALRMVGLAFEVYLAGKAKSLEKAEPQSSDGAATVATGGGTEIQDAPAHDQPIPSVSTATEKSLEAAYSKQQKSENISQSAAFESDFITRPPKAVDIISYGFFFIGLHKGPYYRWKIYEDHFNNTYGVLGDCRVITEHKLKKAAICSCIYIFLRMHYDPQVYFQPHFYEIYDGDFRYLYSVPHLIMYFLKHQIVMLFCTAVCTESGFGVYPAKTHPVPGHGPTTNLGVLKIAATNTEVALEQEYNFSMLKCYENEKLFLGPRMGDTLKAWDMPTQYWFRAYMYRNLVKTSKELRSIVSCLAWTVWLGVSIRQVIVAITLWIYCHLEREFEDLYDTTGPFKLSWSMGFSIMRIMCLVYLTPCIVVNDTKTVLMYYNSINWIFHIVLLCLIVYAIVVYKFRRSHVV